jgi:DNA-binding GntR family transcriptional regulator
MDDLLIEIEKEFKPKYHVSLVEQLTAFFTDAIVGGRLKGGERLVENELQRKFGISRAPIRESLRILEKNGLVVTIPRKGSFVRKIEQKDIEENFPIRSYLESLAARQAIANLTPEDIKSMEESLAMMTDMARKNDFNSYLKHHSSFHRTFIYASNNKRLIELVELLRSQMIWFRVSYLYVQENYEYAIRVHRQILDLFIKKDSDRVEALVKEHILIALDSFLNFLATKNGMQE